MSSWTRSQRSTSSRAPPKPENASSPATTRARSPTRFHWSAKKKKRSHRTRDERRTQHDGRPLESRDELQCGGEDLRLLQKHQVRRLRQGDERVGGRHPRERFVAQVRDVQDGSRDG